MICPSVVFAQQKKKKEEKKKNKPFSGAKYFLPLADLRSKNRKLNCICVDFASPQSRRDFLSRTASAPPPNETSRMSSQRLQCISFLTINDIYEVAKIKGRGGIAEIGRMIKEERGRLRAQGHEVVVTVNGDFLSANETAMVYKGAHVVELFNDWAVDFVVLGNHEFDYGAPHLRTLMQTCNFTWLGSNVRQNADDTLFISPATPLPASGQEGQAAADAGIHFRRYLDGQVEIAYFGLCTEETPYQSFPGESVVFQEELGVAGACVEKIRAARQHVAPDNRPVIEATVALTHMRLAQDRELATRHDSDLDFILGGHDHEPVSMMIGTTLIHKSGQNAEWLGRVDLVVDLDKRAKFLEWKMLLNGPHEIPDPASASILEKYVAPSSNRHVETLLTVRGKALNSLSGLCRSQETTMGQLVSDAMAHVWQTPIACINGGYIRGNHVYMVGDPFTTADLEREFPFEGPTCKIKILGSSLWTVIEEQLSHLPDKFGGFGHFSGLKRFYSPNEPPMQRLKRVQTLDRATGLWEELDLNAEYEMALTCFMYGQGDNIKGYATGTRMLEDNAQRFTRNIVLQFLQDVPDYFVQPDDQRIVLLD